MMKKLSCIMLTFLMILSICVFGVSAEEASGKTIKKIVSIVYDDSGSMNNSNEDWAYASYSLQNLIGLMNSQDEISVVKMSSPTETVSFDLSTNDARKNGIKTVEGWGARGGTPFTAVQTAIDWLKTKKSGYVDSQSVEFWLVIITDGSFENGYPTDMTNYLTELKGSMGSSKYEGVFVAIGNNVPNSVKTDWTSVTGNHLLTAANSNDIVDAMAEVSGLILGQGGKSTDISITATADGKGITFISPFPLKKFIVYEQNQSVGISSVSVDGAKVKTTADFSANKPGQASIASRTIHCEGDGSDYIPAGLITVSFDSKIDITSNKFKILTDSAVNVDFKVLDKAGQAITDLDSASLAEGDTVEFAATVTSSIDKSPINLKNWMKDLSAELVVNDQSIAMEYNPSDNTFYGSFKISSGSNLAYAIVTLPGYFRSKSDVVNIYPIEVIDNPSASVSDNEIDVVYKHCDDFEEIGAFTYTISGGAMHGICDFEFQNMPKGITVSVNGIYADENGKLSVKIRNDVPADVKLYRNKDYAETEKSTVSINVTTDQYVLQWEKDSITEFVLNPVQRNITVDAIRTNESGTLRLKDFDGKSIYILQVSADGKCLSYEELEALTVEFTEIDGVALKTEVVEYNGENALRVTCNQTGSGLFMKVGDFTSDVTLTTEYGESSETTELSFHIKDSISRYLLPLLLLLLIIFLIGYIPGIKKRLSNKKYHIRANGEDEEIYVKLSTRLLPYVAEKGTSAGLTLVATSNKNKVYVVNDFFDGQKASVDGEPIEEGISKIKLLRDSELKVTESNNETVYVYCDSRDDDTFGDDFDEFDGDDLYNDDTDAVGSGGDYDDSYYN